VELGNKWVAELLEVRHKSYVGTLAPTLLATSLPPSLATCPRDLVLPRPGPSTLPQRRGLLAATTVRIAIPI